MTWSRTPELLQLLQEKDYRTAKQLASQLGVSEKTIRLKIQEMNGELEKYGACVESKARFGYRLEVTDRSLFASYPAERESSGIPDGGKERSEYLLTYLLFRKDYVKAEELCEFMYISKTTLTNSLRMVEAILKRYELKLDRRPNYGIRVIGEEFDIRRLICDYYIKRYSLEEQKISHQGEEFLRLADQVRELMVKYDIYLSELSFENFVSYVYVAWKRMKFGWYLKQSRENLPEMGIKEQAFIHELLSVMEKIEKIPYTEDEENYLLLYLAGKRMIGNVMENDSNFVIHEKTDKLALDMLKVVSQEYQMDFYNNFEIRMTLNQHLAPFDVRMRFGIPLKNPLLSEIKEKYCLAFQMAHVASRVLRDYYGKEISEDEIGYFALIFELEMERDKTGNRYNILVVCSTGKGTSRLLKYKYEHEFAEYLKTIYVCDLLGFESFDTSSVDYIFTTVPITRKVSVPIIEVGVLLGAEDIRKITGVLQHGASSVLVQRYYGEKRFLSHVPVDTKENILAYICRIISEQEQVDGDFYEQVLEREAFAQMDYGNHITIPHPNRIASEQTFAYVAVLEQPVIWNHLPVQVIFLTSVGRTEDPDRQKFYETTARFALSSTAVQELIETPEYKKLEEILQK